MLNLSLRNFIYVQEVNMQGIKVLFLMAILSLISIIGCGGSSERMTTIKHLPITNLDSIISVDEVEFDLNRTVDGNGSIKIIADQPKVIHLYELKNIDIEDARLIYMANVKTENVNGRVYLEMWCKFNDLGEYFGRDLQSPLTGTNDWMEEESYFILKKMQNPDEVKLNIVIDGTGTVWIDDIRLIRAPLK